ncbi:RsmB/NOP family class I SAM-dependent RNA methyltransferase [Alteriqipengyuania lutimaris]|uniref:Methyltransferase domain-containing protein n=1 Tax=Alteriqipengyuania lutimaris TaxID=1538146 RepID=A0A395LP05_9SPHN|nr:methyltransferase domain-containing protein [Alteriqipengyuania lutimaris]MBB3033754.1 16S rRNA (cytosine967-C5)-methyltransferase [Alteriqipengyuania lutimaris]RDS77264.1 methyltransferase domain-containing protein [Alteriqipengyuania lutimaris]
MSKGGSEAEVAGLPARRAALRMLDGVLRRGETLEQNETAALRGLPASDAGLARAIAAETLRWLVDFDAAVDSATREVLPDDAKPRTVLRLMLAQWLRLDTPPHAVIATALPLLSGGPKRLAHGVFGALAKRGLELPAAPTLPAAVAARWGERSTAIAAGLAEPPPLDLTLRDPAKTAEWAVKLGADSLMPGHLRLSRGQAVHGLEGFEDGAWWVQDLAASLPARMLGDGERKRALDLCAAPGGKTLQLAAQGWQVTALDISAKRLKLLEQNLARTGLEAEVIAADAFKWEPEAPFDAILIDAPCTATGTARRHPDVLHRIGPRQIADLAEVQARLIERASGWLTPGGTLAYAVCSLESEEGEGQVANVSLTPDPIRAEELPEGLSPSAQGHLRTDPGMLPEQGGLDGFFVARWRKG